MEQALWRIEKARYGDAPFSGTGALYVAGRWHPQGIRVAYAAETLSLALLEKLAGSPRAALPTEQFVVVEASVPAGLVLRVEDWVGLPDGWDAVPPPYRPEGQAVGARFVREQAALVLSVPSAINPFERNFILNPEHPEIGALIVKRTGPFALDRRLW